MGGVLLAAGAAGKRYVLPNATVHMHQAHGGAQGAARDIEIMANEVLRQQTVLRQLLVKHTGQPLDRIERDSDRDFWLSAPEAVDYGLADEILRPAHGGPLPFVGGNGSTPH
jgi:ATP-dependent Clp protease protease subunit